MTPLDTTTEPRDLLWPLFQQDWLFECVDTHWNGDYRQYLVNPPPISSQSLRQGFELIPQKEHWQAPINSTHCQFKGAVKYDPDAKTFECGIMEVCPFGIQPLKSHIKIFLNGVRLVNEDGISKFSATKVNVALFDDDGTDARLHIPTNHNFHFMRAEFQDGIRTKLTYNSVEYHNRWIYYCDQDIADFIRVNKLILDPVGFNLFPDARSELAFWTYTHTCRWEYIQG